MVNLNFERLEKEIERFTSVDEHLQLAAELGKTLLERNKELETLLKEHKQKAEEQEKEIVHLKKAITAMDEVNESRMNVYEQLEVGIQDLERDNRRLMSENSSSKKQIKSLSHNLESLETRCADLQKQLEETRQALTAERRKNERLMQENRFNGASENEAIKLKTSEKTAQHNLDETQEGFEANTTAPENCSYVFGTLGGASPRGNANSTGISGTSGNPDQSLDLSMVGVGAEDNEDIIKLVNELETTKKAFLSEQQRCGELEEQLMAIIQENQSLQGRLAQTSANEEMKSMHDELSILDEVRQGQMCSRCFRAMEDRVHFNYMDDEQSSMAPTEECEEDEASLLDLDERQSVNSQSGFRSSVSIKVGGRNIPNNLDLDARASPNPYRDLVEKYEALLEVQRSSLALKTSNGSCGGAGGLSLAEEFQTTGEFNHTQKMMLQAVASENCAASSNGDEASSCNGSMNNDKTVNKQNRGRTPTEFSEAETSSSGFSDETSNKCTQTDDRPGYFLCSIGDGEDCKFSIYDDASPIDSRFRNRPEYRELFKEIFAVLRKAAENKEEGEKLPLLDDTQAGAAGAAAAKVPPVTPANEEPPMDFGDDAQSVISSAISEQSFAMSECITKMERKTAKKHIIEKNQENKPPTQLATVSPSVKEIIENGRVLTPLKREPLEYLTVGVGLKKKNRKKNRNFSTDRSESPVALPSPPRFFVSSGKKRKDMRPFVQSPMAMEQPSTSTGGNSSNYRSSRGAKCEWNGSSMIIYNRGIQSPLRGRELDMSGFEYRPSTASQELHKLKKLDLSYAEVLRRADACKQHYHHHQQQQQQQQHRRRHHH